MSPGPLSKQLLYSMYKKLYNCILCCLNFSCESENHIKYVAEVVVLSTAVSACMLKSSVGGEGEGVLLICGNAH